MARRERSALIARSSVAPENASSAQQLNTTNAGGTDGRGGQQAQKTMIQARQPIRQAGIQFSHGARRR